MKRVALTLAVLIVLVGHGLAPLGTQAQEQAVSPTVAVFVISKDPSGKSSRWATAFHVGDGKFYTNGHVIDVIGPASFWGPSGWWIGADLWVNVPGKVSGFRRTPNDTFGPATEFCKDPRWKGSSNPLAYLTGPFDFASFKIASLDLPSYKLASKDPQVRDHVSSEGFARASSAWPPKLYTWNGTVSEVGDGWMWITVTEGFNIPGSSGSPIRNEAGDVVGVLYGGDYPADRRTPAMHALAVPISAMQSSACR